MSDDIGTGTNRAVLSVGDLTRSIKQLLENRYSSITVEGEVIGTKTAASGHTYFSLKDDEATISAVLFRNVLGKFLPRDGDLVRVTGRVSVYPPRGTYQIICERIEEAGLGEMLRRLEERKRRLEAEGLFDPSRKRPIPMMPTRIAVVTSPSGAAIRDILNVLGRRNAGLHLVILPTLVQGRDAAAGIAAQIRRAGRYAMGDVIVVTRGGGSMEDLLPFSEEIVVRAVAESPIPVISAVGHEIDTPLCDLAADRREPTPSAAAETVTGRRDQMLSEVLRHGRSIVATFLGRMREAKLLVSRFTSAELMRTFDAFRQPYLQRLDDAKETIVRAINNTIQLHRHQLALAGSTIESLSPMNVLSRGYAIVRRDDGRVVTRAGDAAEGERLHVGFSTDSLTAIVDAVQHTDAETADGDAPNPVANTEKYDPNGDANGNEEL